jgi:hypothetical protein
MEKADLLLRRINVGMEAPTDRAFTSRPFTLCSLPIRRLPRTHLLYERHNGHFSLEVTGHPSYGIPWGQDRLIPLYFATQAVKRHSRTITFDSAATILDALGLPKDGPHYRRLVDGFKRIFHATVFFRIAAPDNERVARFAFFDETRLWYAPSPSAPTLPGTENYVVLSESFWSELQAHPIPVDMAVVRALAANSGALDFYLWLSWRSYRADSARIPLLGSDGLIQQLGVGDYARDRKFREAVRRWLAQVQAAWPSCPATLDKTSSYLNL